MKQSSIDILVNAIYERFGIANCGDMKEEINQAKQMHKQELESTYNHAMWALMDTGHGDSFDEYYKNTYEKEN